MLRKVFLLDIFFITFFFGFACAAEFETRFATIVYKNDSQLKTFNQKFDIGRLSFYIKDTAETVQDEIRLKLDIVISRIQAILDMSPEDLQFKIFLLDSKKEVFDAYKKLYGSSPGFIAFYSVGKNTVYISLEDTELKVIAHEFGHAVIENYFDVSPPRKIHEVLAQFAESHIYD